MQLQHPLRDLLAVHALAGEDAEVPRRGDALLDGALTEEVFPTTAGDAPPVGKWQDWLDPIAKTVLDETSGAPEGPIAALGSAARAFGLDPEVVLAEALAREIRREMTKSGGPKLRRESSHVDAGLWSSPRCSNRRCRCEFHARRKQWQGRRPPK